MVGIGMVGACKHFADYDAAETAADAFHFLHRVAFQTGGREEGCQPARVLIEVDVALKPLVRDIHSANLQKNSLSEAKNLLFGIYRSNYL